MRKLLWHETVIVEGDEAKVADRYAYFPSTTSTPLSPAIDHRSLCPWKAPPGYYHIDGAVNRSAAYCYPEPSRRAAPLVGGHVALWGAEIEVDNEEQRPSLFARLSLIRLPPLLDEVVVLADVVAAS